MADAYTGSAICMISSMVRYGEALTIAMDLPLMQGLRKCRCVSVANPVKAQLCRAIGLLR